MQVQDIYIYPVKSLGGIRKENEVALERGFAFDRRWMLVDENGVFITQRTYPELALLQTEISTQQLLVFQKDKHENKISMPITPSEHVLEKVEVWGDQTNGMTYPDKINLWFSNYLGKACKLVFMDEKECRSVDPKYSESETHVSFADGFPYLLISQASLDDLNQRMPESVPMDRFRPNLVISGTKPYEEDSWAKIKIGEVLFAVAKPCGRCVLTTVDQELGKKGTEPLSTLASYRTTGNKVLFGQNLIALNEGTIHLNDQVEVLSRKKL